jgi:UDP-glucose:(glucosyl)LPS alpha-1,2-glucosyltransferase
MAKSVSYEHNNLSQNAMGGTELMLKGLFDRLPEGLLSAFQIIPTRVRALDDTRFRVLWIHDLAEDTECAHLADGGYRKFHKLVFVSHWQMQQFIQRYNIPWSHCVVLHNAIEPLEFRPHNPREPIRLIYTPTPHRGLSILVPVFDKLCEKYPNLHLDVYSSFALYGWPQNDRQFEPLFEQCRQHPYITYHGSQPNVVVREALARADIFAYPSIWPETSCLCLIEAMSAGLRCVHPNLGALFETGANLTRMYPYHEDSQAHARLFYAALDHTIQQLRNDIADTTERALRFQKNYADMFYGWEGRKKQWEMLLKAIMTTNEPRPVADLVTHRQRA